MHPFPHEYEVSAAASGERLTLRSGELAPIESAAPAEFDGPGDKWSPETLMTAAVADCFILTFKAVAAASRFEWENLECRVKATLDRVERVTRFTHFVVTAELTVPAGTDEAQAVKLLEKSEANCLVANSLIAEVALEPSVVVSPGR
ncbi:MAG: OsmC family protein [Pseudomonadales bacterium]|nr:OsmC family protein [Pseudomonadales bacterium]